MRRNQRFAALSIVVLAAAVLSTTPPGLAQAGAEPHLRDIDAGLQLLDREVQRLRTEVARKRGSGAALVKASLPKLQQQLRSMARSVTQLQQVYRQANDSRRLNASIALGQQVVSLQQAVTTLAKTAQELEEQKDEDDEKTKELLESSPLR